MQDFPAYDPDASYDFQRLDLTYRRHGEIDLPVHVYQPQGVGPFPALIDVHGGAWGNGDPLQNSKAQEALAASGVVVAAIDFRTSAVARHPAALEDISYAIRWLKARAGDLNASPAGLGGIGWSSGGHLLMLSAMRPRSYATLALPEGHDIEASLAYAILGWPVIDPLARYRLALEGSLLSRERGVNDFSERHLAYFGSEAAMEEANPQLIVERGEDADLPPSLIIQGASDAQLPHGGAERFVEAYAGSGGRIELGKYPGAPHGFIRDPGPNAERAIEQIKHFIARRLGEMRATPEG